MHNYKPKMKNFFPHLSTFSKILHKITVEKTLLFKFLPKRKMISYLQTILNRKDNFFFCYQRHYSKARHIKNMQILPSITSQIR